MFIYSLHAAIELTLVPQVNKLYQSKMRFIICTRRGNTSLSQNVSMIPPQGKVVQVINMNGNHCVALSTVNCFSGSVKFIDSFGYGKVPK